MLNYNGTIYRPPLEAYTLLLPVNEGCSHNRCKFCNMYRDIKFRMLSAAEIESWLAEVYRVNGEYCAQLDRVYLVGADPFAVSASNLERVINLIRKYLPNVKVISMYAAIRNIMSKSDAQLERLKNLGVNDLYVGVESGLDDVLSHLNKGNTVADVRRQCQRLNAVGIRHMSLLMLGADCGLPARRPSADDFDAESRDCKHGRRTFQQDVSSDSPVKNFPGRFGRGFLFALTFTDDACAVLWACPTVRSK